MAGRRNHYDVTNTVNVSDPRIVEDAVCGILATRFPGTDLAPVRAGFEVFSRLFAGAMPGYLGCDTWYHDVQHSLDCTLAMARIVDGHERSAPAALRLGERRARLGVIVALFHDAGYIRRDDDDVDHGAEFTLFHVRRSGEFLSQFLPSIGFGAEADLTRQLVHYTGYEIALDKIRVTQPRDREMGFLLGTADVLAQTADRCYLEKCRDYLYREFEICGLAGDAKPGGPRPIYTSVDQLLEKTPEFNDKLWRERLDGYFGRIYRYMESHFDDGSNPYVDAIEGHLLRLSQLLKSRRLDRLNRRPQAVGAAELRRLLKLKRWHPQRPHAPRPHALARWMDPGFVPT